MDRSEHRTPSDATWRDRLTRRHLLGASATVVAGVLAYPVVSRFQDAVSASPREAVNAGLDLHRLGKYEEAIRAFTEAIDSDRDLPDAYVLCGIFSTALKLTPGDATVYLYRGDAYLALGRKERAARDYQKSADLAGDERLAVAARVKLRMVASQ